MKVSIIKRLQRRSKLCTNVAYSAYDLTIYLGQQRQYHNYSMLSTSSSLLYNFTPLPLVPLLVSLSIIHFCKAMLFWLHRGLHQCLVLDQQSPKWATVGMNEHSNTCGSIIHDRTRTHIIQVGGRVCTQIGLRLNRKPI